MSESGGQRRGLFSWFLGNRTITNVSPTTEVGIPRMTWRMMLLAGTLLVLFAWMLYWAGWLYDSIKTKGAYFSYWYRRMWWPWWKDGGYVLFAITQIISWILATLLFYYRMMTEQGAKEWRAEYGPYYPGKKVPPEERLP